MDPREAFKVGFLARCVEEGLSLEEAGDRVKQASEKLAGITDLLGKVVDLGKPVVGAGMNWGIPAMLAGPPILGGIAGFTAGKATDIDDLDVDEVKKRELIDELNRQTERLKRERSIRDYRSQRKQTGRVFL